MSQHRPSMDSTDPPDLRVIDMTIKIVGHEKTKDHKKDKTHINYVIAVSVGVSGGSWRIKRRFQAFRAMHDALLKAGMDKAVLPSLPNKKLKRSFKQEYVEGRQEELEEYLIKLSTTPGVAAQQAWCSFLVGTFIDIMGRSQDQEQLVQTLVGDAKKAIEDKSQLDQLLKQSDTEVERLQQELSALQAEYIKTSRKLDELESRTKEAEAISAKAEEEEATRKAAEAGEQEKAKQALEKHQAELAAVREKAAADVASAEQRCKEQVEAARAQQEKEHNKAHQQIMRLASEVNQHRRDQRVLVKEVLMLHKTLGINAVADYAAEQEKKKKAEEAGDSAAAGDEKIANSSSSGESAAEAKAGAESGGVKNGDAAPLSAADMYANMI